MIPRRYLAAPVRLLLLFVVLAGVPLAGLAWLGWGLLRQDRELEIQRERDRIQNLANELADHLDQRLASRDSASPGATREALRNAVFLLIDSRGVLRQDGVRLPYYPQIAPQADVSPDLFAATEALEFQRGDAAKASEIYRRLITSSDLRIKAGALMRFARSLREQSQNQEALDAYADLAALGDVSVADSPAELLARRERISLFRALGDRQSAQREQASLASSLADGRFLLDQTTFDFYRESTASPAPPNNAALAQVARDLWPRWQQQSQGRQAWATGSTAWASVWRQTPEGTAAMLGFALSDPSAARRVSATRRNLATAGFALMVLIICAASYFVFHAVNRELGVARLQSDFVSAVSHEFRTPLTAMRHLTEMLEEGDTPSDRLPHYYQALGKETRRLQALVESLLDFGRMQAGRRTYRMELTSAIELAEQAVDELRPQAASMDHQLELTAPAGPMPIRADRDALGLALRNLVDNAIKYSPESSTVRVSVDRKNGFVEMSVRDQGAGIPIEEQREVFRRFVRGSAAKTLNVKGTGIGLAMAEQIVKAHGGRLELASEAGHGSRFTILLPSEDGRT